MERIWEYDCHLNFNGQKITKLTITDHWQAKHPEISIDLIVKLVNKLDGKEAELTNYQGERKVFKWRTFYQNNAYRIIFWFKDSTTNHLWIRNCYPID
ncbi:MAG: hypothetical protein mread185_000707 [Mycoplasmataceae bacterium]|nr:MAG: hypothetical protein mread185_000567 [Mycoplasmataceae bacterium]WNE41250.1 MAG: hypothetical protein mread185_000707 [Mycoplasmataceae bacterium]